MRLCACLLAMLALTPLAFADSPSDADIAQHYFAAGREAFGQARYEEALAAFRAAARLAPRAELDYDIGLCAERLGRPDEAAEAYEHFLHTEHDGSTGAEVELRLRALRAPPPRRVLRLQTAAIGVAAVTVALAAIGGGLIGAIDGQYNALHSGCGKLGQCSPASYQGIEERDVASKVLFGAAGAALAVDIGFWVAWARERRSRAKTAP